MDRRYFLEKLPKKRIAVGVLLFDEFGRLLILKPSYKKDWTIPGGVVEKYESLLQAVKRESKEEIGLDIEISKFLLIDFQKEQLPDGYSDESLQIIFLGEKLSQKDCQNIRIDGKEIVEHQFVKFDEALEVLGKKLSRRLKSLRGDFEKFVLMENGEIIL